MKYVRVHVSYPQFYTQSTNVLDVPYDVKGENSVNITLLSIKLGHIYSYISAYTFIWLCIYFNIHLLWKYKHFGAHISFKYKCKNIFTKMLNDVGIEMPKSIETRSKFSMHADKGRG